MIYQTAKAVGARPVPSVKRIWLEEKATRAEEAALICACDEVAASVSNATAGSTSVVTVTFHRDSTDKNFSYAQVYLRATTEIKRVWLSRLAPILQSRS